VSSAYFRFIPADGMNVAHSRWSALLPATVAAVLIVGSAGPAVAVGVSGERTIRATGGAVALDTSDDTSPETNPISSPADSVAAGTPARTTVRTLELGSTSHPATGVSVPHVQPVGVPIAPVADGSVVEGPVVAGRVLRTSAAGTTFSAVAVTWQRDQSLGRISVAVRTRVADQALWSGWTTTGVGSASPNQGTSPNRDTNSTERDGAGLLWTGVSRAVDIVVTSVSGQQPVDVQATLIDPGRAGSDAAAGPITASPPALVSQTDETPGAPSALMPGIAALAAPTEAAVPQPVSYGNGVVQIYGRAAWGANPAYMTLPPEYAPRVQAVVLHHTATSNSYLAGDVPAIIRAIYYQMAVTENLGDIGFNALVDKFGRIWEGRVGGLNTAVIGSHAGGFNIGTSGVAMIGDYDKVAVTAATREAVARYTAFKLGTNGVDPNGTPWITGGPSTKYATKVTMQVHAFYPHRDTSLTTCPGNYGVAILGLVRTRAKALIASYKVAPTVVTPPVVPVVEPPATATSTSPVAVPAAGLSLYGAGYGHGWGLSQWGARGAAAKGLTGTQIVNFYFPGAALTAGGNPTIRIRLTAIDAGHFSFYPPPGASMVTGLVATAGNGGKVVLPSRAAYHVAMTGTSFVVQEPVTATAWRTVATLAGPVTFTGQPTVTLQLSKPKGDCKGGARISFPGAVQAVNYQGQARYMAKMSMDNYLHGVVASEMPAGWAAAALQSQAIAARTYATAHLTPSVYYDMVDTQANQCWDGVASETAATTAAINATAGKVLTSGGKAISALFSSDNGGWTVSGGETYLPAKADSYSTTSGSPYVNWTSVLTPAALAAGDGAGGLTAVRSVQVTKRTGGGRWGGRVTTIQLTGVNAAGAAITAVVTGSDFRSRLGLRSNYFGFAK
jgi:stage II sporulation protein D